MSGLGNISDLQLNGYAEKVTIFDPVTRLPVDWSNLGAGAPIVPTTIYDSHFLSTEMTAADPDNLAFQLCPQACNLKAIKITNSFYVDLFAQIFHATDEATFLLLNGHAERFLVGSMQTIALDGENLFTKFTAVPGDKLFIRFSTELYNYVPLTGVFPSSQRVVGNALCFYPS